jgi:hypothetical protein
MTISNGGSMPILRSLLLLVALFTPALGEDGSRVAARGEDAAKALQLYLDGVASSGQRPDYTKPPAADLFLQVFDLEQLTALPPPEASDMSWVVDWLDAVKDTYKRVMFFGATLDPKPDLVAIGHNMEAYEDQYAAAMTFMLRLLSREAATAFLFTDQLTPEERTAIREAGFHGFRVSGAQMLDNAIPPIAAGMRPANARLITAAMRDTRDVWAKFILPDDRPRIITLLTRAQHAVNDDEVRDNLAVFAERLSAEQGNAK